MRCSRWSSLALSALSALALAAPAQAANLAIADGGLSLMAGDGGARTQITSRGSAEFSDPAWAPDGKRLVALRTTGVGAERERSALYVVGLDGRTAPLRGGESLTSPDWSPDGSTIVAMRIAGLKSEIVAVDAAGGTPRTLTSGGLDLSPAWSPDGTRLAFVRATQTDAQLMVARADGSDAHAIAQSAGEPAWSPDGSRIAFVSTAEHNGQTCFEECSTNGEIHVVGADGAGERRLTNTQADERAPAWSPDGTRIAYASDRGSSDAGPEVFAMDPDGGCLTQLTWGSGNASAPAWQPGSGAAERGPCGRAATNYLLDLDLRVLRVRDAVPLYLGTRFGRRYFSEIGAGSAIYSECAGLDLTRCQGNVQVQNYTVCKRNPARIDLRPSFARAVRGALVLGYNGDIEVLSGGTDTVVFLDRRAPTAAYVRTVVAALRPLGGGSARGRLPAPRLPRAALRRLRSDRRVLRVLQRLHATRGPQPRCAR